MLSYNEILPKKFIVLDGDPYEVLSSWVFRKQQRKPVNQTKLRSLKTGGMLERTFHQNDKVDEASIEQTVVKYLYHNKGEYWFCNPKNPKERYELPESLLGKAVRYIKENSDVDGLLFNDEIIGISIPVKMDFVVAEAAPAVRGNTAQGATKTVVIETGTPVVTPLFINEGDVIRVNTDTGDYVERVEKK